MPDAPKRKVLSVEDEPSVRSALLARLSGLGCDVDVASSGTQAIDIIRRAKFDAVLLDLRCAKAQAEEVVPSIQAVRPSLLANVLVITGDVADAKAFSRTVLARPGFRQSASPGYSSDPAGALVPASGSQQRVGTPPARG